MEEPRVAGYALSGFAQDTEVAFTIPADGGGVLRAPLVRMGSVAAAPGECAG